MRVLFVHSIGRKKYGGGERWVISAASGLQKKGHTVFVAGVKNSVLLAEAAKNNISTAVFNVFSDLNLFQAYRLSWFIRKHKFDVVICKGRELVITGLAVKWGGMPVLIRRTGSPPPSKSKKLVVRTRLFVDGVITNTETIRKIYADHGFTDDAFVKVIYNGLQTDDQIDPFAFKTLFPGQTIVLSAGRVTGHKGYFFLIDALVQLKLSQPNLLFYILGEGRDKEKLVRYAREKGVEDMIFFAGYAHDPVPYFKGCDLFIHPSLYEGMPNAAMEAMAYGKPVIMTQVNGADELSDYGKYALLIPPANKDAIVDAVNKVMNNMDEYTHMGLQAQQYVRQKFGILTMVEELEKFFTARISNKKKAVNP